MSPRSLVQTVGIALSFVTLFGCSQESSRSTGGTEAPSGKPAAIEYEGIAAAVEIKGPEGWTRSTSGAWVVWASADKRTQLALTPLLDERALPDRLKELEGVFGVTDVRLSSAQPLVIGPDKLAAQGADGAAHFASGDGVLAYATLETGGPKPALVAYAFDKDAPPEARQQAMAAVASLRKKR